MHQIFQKFVDHISSALDASELRDAMAEAAAGLDLSYFAYLSVPNRPDAVPHLISTYPLAWTEHYLRNRYEQIDAVIRQAMVHMEPFEWGLGAEGLVRSERQRELFEEAARFGIRCGFTIPIHDARGPIAAVTFAADEREQRFERCIKKHGRVLQLMAMYFNAQVGRTITAPRTVDGISLSPREFECLEWAAKGKSAWDIGRILGISRHTAAFHLENAKTKLGVRTIVQAVARLTAAKSIMK